MRLPDAPLALLMALIPTFALVGLAWWRIQSGRNLSAFQGAALGVGLSLAALVLTISATYSFPLLSELRASKLLLIAPLGTYFIVLLLLCKRAKIEGSSLGLWGVVGLVPLFFVGFYASLLAACSFGDCL